MSAPGTTSPARRAGRGWWMDLLQVAASVLLVVLIVHRFSFGRLKEQVLQTNALALVLPFAILVAANVLGALQWGWILRASGLQAGFGRIIRVYWTGLFLNNFLPGSVGGDVYKVFVVGRETGGLTRVVGATIVDRVMGLAVLCTLASLTALGTLGTQNAPMHLSLFVLAFTSALLLVSALVLHPRGGAWLIHVVARIRWLGLGARLSKVLDDLQQYRSRTRLLNGAFLLSLGVQTSRVVAHFAVAQAMGWGLGSHDLAKFFLVIPILGLLMALPISFGGWGVREWVGVALFEPLGHGGEEAVTLLALTASLSLIASLPGAVAYFLGSRRGGSIADPGRPA